jgi:hypothetical protein
MVSELVGQGIVLKPSGSLTTDCAEASPTRQKRGMM